RRSGLCRTEAPDALHLRCSELVHQAASRRPAEQSAIDRSQTAAFPGVPVSHALPRAEPGSPNPQSQNLQNRNPELRTFGTSRTAIPNAEPRTPAAISRRLAPYALAASLVTIVGGAFVYQATGNSTRIMAAELVADHTKCFALNSALGTHQAASVVEQSMMSSF